MLQNIMEGNQGKVGENLLDDQRKLICHTCCAKCYFFTYDKCFDYTSVNGNAPCGLRG